jgi:hypothetical protein
MVVTHENGAEEAINPKGAKRRKAKAVEQQAEPGDQSASSEQTASQPEPEPTREEQTEQEQPKRKARVAKRKAEGAVLRVGELAERYLEHLEASGKSHGTIFSYGIELKTAQKALGAETLISALTPALVGTYFESAVVMKLKSGRPKALPSFMKTRRVLRLALVWAVEQGWLAKVPLPEQAESK